MRRPTLPRAMLAVSAVLLVAYAFGIAPRIGSRPARNGDTNPAVTAERAASPSAKPPEVFPPSGKMFIGITTDEGPYNFAAVDQFTAATKREPQVMLFSAGWATTEFDRILFDRIRDRGMMPMLAWEPWDYRLDEQARADGYGARAIDEIRSDQPRYQLSRITRGDFDSYLLSWAQGIKSLGYPVAIRFAHEMNGDWYPWCETVNGNRAGDYVGAWRHVHDVFRSAGVTNVTWVWSPNARWDDSTPPLSLLYPGDEYVDWVGISGYYGTGDWADYRSFDSIFTDTVDEIRVFTRRPLVITETGATDDSGRKVEWIEETFRSLPRHKDIIGLIWFEVDKELDWRVVSSRASAEAFAQAVAVPRYDLHWSPDMVPRTKLDD